LTKFGLNVWAKFWNWYSKWFEKTLWLTAIILLIQIPHMIWAGDLFLQLGLIAGAHPALDFLLYGVDLIEIPLIINICMQLYYVYFTGMYKKWKGK